MLLRQRQPHRLRQRTLLMLALLACNQALAESDSQALSLTAPANSLRRGETTAVTDPKAEDRLTKNQATNEASKPRTAVAVMTVPLVPLAQGEMVTQTPVPLVTPLMPRFSPAEMLLVSDGWNARKAIDLKTPLVDPTATAPSYAQSKRSKAAEGGKVPAPIASAPILVAPSTSAPQRDASSPVPAKQSDAPEASTADWAREPKSTLKFIIPQTEPKPNTLSQALPNTAPSPPTTQGEQTPALPERIAPETSPERIAMAPAMEPSKQSNTNPANTNAANNSAANNSARVIDESIDETIVDPEQNEPEGLNEPSEGGTIESADAGDSEMPMNVEELPLEEMGSDLDSLSDEPEELEVLPPADDSKPSRLEVRELKLDTDGSLDAENSEDAEKSPDADKTDQAPKSEDDRPANLESNRQSVGDEPVPLKAANARVALNVDRIGPKGDLILAIGMDTQRHPLTAQASRLRVPIERTLNHYWNKPEDAEERTHWGMFHNIMIYDKDTPIIANKRKFNAVAWMAGNNACRNQLLFEEDSRGINVKSGVGLQGHQAQLLAVFGLIDVPAAYPLYVGRNRYSVQDVVRREMLACQSGAELTFTLIGMAHYVDSDSQWVADDGQDWNVERLIQEELSQPIVGAACGGTHRLMGFAHALRRRRAEGKPITGQWDRADQYVNDFIEYTWQLQNRDGSMSTAWFEQPEDNGKIDRKLQTTGHMLEFLLTAVPDDQLQSARMLRTVNFLATTLYEERGHEWQVGPKGHALRALAMYYRRVFGRPDPWRPVAVARHSTSRAR